jgi:hypothetical protein
MVCLGNICINTLYKGDDDDDDDNNNNNNNVKVHNMFNMLNNMTCSTNCKYRTAATLYTIEMWFISSI